MKRTWIIVGISAAIAVSSLFMSQAVYATKKACEEEPGTVCTTCHDKPGSKLLTDQGMYYELTRNLDDYEKIESAFGRCTHCHSRKPGSKELTDKGKAMLEAVGDMEELRVWVRESHPAELGDPQEDEEEEE